MTQGTTPLHIIHLPFATDIIDKIEVAYEQNKKILLVKKREDITLGETSVSIRLSQDETLLFDYGTLARVQIHLVTTGGDVLASKPMKVPVYILLDKKVL